MRIARRERDGGGLLARAADVLGRLPTEALRYREHGVRHPLGVFNQSTTRFGRAVLGAIDALATTPLQEQLPQLGYPVVQPVLEGQLEVLESLLAFFDAGYGILRSTMPYARGHTFADKWLEARGHPSLDIYRDGIQEIRSRYAPIVNKVKHDGRALGWLGIVDGNRSVQGYFLEGAEHMGPDPDVHPGGTAYSVPFNLRLCVAGYYIGGELLAQALEQALAPLGYPALAPPAETQRDDSLMFDAVSRTVGLGRWLFPDEAEMPLPLLQARSEGDERSVVVNWPSNNRGMAFRRGTVSCVLAGDGVTREGLVPYMGYFAKRREPISVKGVDME